MHHFSKEAKLSQFLVSISTLLDNEFSISIFVSSRIVYVKFYCYTESFCMDRYSKEVNSARVFRIRPLNWSTSSFSVQSCNLCVQELGGNPSSHVYVKSFLNALFYI